LPLEVGPPANQAGRQVFQLRQLDLKLAFERARALGKYIQDQSRAIDHPALEYAFEIAFLRRRQIVIEQHDLDVMFTAQGRKFVGFAAAHG